jgi:hypothetical protein
VFGGAFSVPAAAGTTGASRSIALAASPARVNVEGSATATVRVSNSGRQATVVEVRRAGFALDLRGRPRIVRAGKRSAQSWITVRPASFALPAGGAMTMTVSAKLPHRVEPGDHAALVLLSTQPRRHAGLAVRLRLGVVVEIRAPGRIVRRLALGGLRVRRNKHVRAFDLLVVNHGNVTEHLSGERMSFALTRRGRLLGALRPEPRDLLPRSRGLVSFRYRGHARGAVVLRAAIETNGSTVSRTYRLRL